jgi:hypothetical protein
MAPKKKKTFNQELEGLDQEELSTFNVEKFYTPKMTDDTKKTMLTAVVGKVQKALGEAIAEKNQKTVENGILTASVEEEALQPYKSTSIIEHIAYRYAIVAGDSSFRGGDTNKRVREVGSTDERPKIGKDGLYRLKFEICRACLFAKRSPLHALCLRTISDGSSMQSHKTYYESKAKMGQDQDCFNCFDRDYLCVVLTLSEPIKFSLNMAAANFIGHSSKEQRRLRWDFEDVSTINIVDTGDIPLPDNLFQYWIDLFNAGESSMLKVVDFHGESTPIRKW